MIELHVTYGLLARRVRFTTLNNSHPFFPYHHTISKSTEGASSAHWYGIVYLKFVRDKHLYL